MALLLPRLLRTAVYSLVLLALISLPMSRSSRNPGSALAPSIAWAGGSPDETLKPPDSPPPDSSTKKSAAITRTGTTTFQDGLVTHRPFTRLTALQRWQLFFSVFRTYATRF